MVKEVIEFTNAKGDAIRFEGATFGLVSVDGLGDVNSDVQMQSVSGQDGASFIGSVLEPRYVDIEFLIRGNNYDIVKLNRDRLTAVLNPKHGLGILRYISGGVDRYIEAVPERVPTIPDGSANRGETWQRGAVTFVAPNPYWRIGEVKTEVATWIGSFEFPLEIPAETGIELGYRLPSLIVNVYNSGHVPVGMIIKFRALGTLKNPSLINVNTGEFFKINRTMVAGEIITVNTSAGKKRIESQLNGVTTNVFNSIVFGSKFMQLDVGDNLFRYDADENLEALEVDIYHAPAFVGV